MSYNPVESQLKAQIQINRPALRYHGGKWRIAPWIIEQFPAHTCYVEPFGGGASVLLRKAPSHLEVYNDLDSTVVTFFRVLRDRTDELMQAVELTPYSREEMLRSLEPASDELETARRFFVRTWQSRGKATGRWGTGWRYMYQGRKDKGTSSTCVDDFTNIDHLWAVAARFRLVQIEHDDALAVINRFDTLDTLFYVDPPYPHFTRSSNWGRNAYRHEMDIGDHDDLCALLGQVKGMVIVSSYRNPIYDRHFADWEIKTRLNLQENNQFAEEALYISPQAIRRQPQMRLFEEVQE